MEELADRGIQFNRPPRYEYRAVHVTLEEIAPHEVIVAAPVTFGWYTFYLHVACQWLQVFGTIIKQLDDEAQMDPPSTAAPSEPPAVHTPHLSRYVSSMRTVFASDECPPIVSPISGASPRQAKGWWCCCC